MSNERYNDGWYTFSLSDGKSVQYMVCVKRPYPTGGAPTEGEFEWFTAWSTSSLEKAMRLADEYRTGARAGGELGVRLAKETREWLHGTPESKTR